MVRIGFPKNRGQVLTVYNDKDYCRLGSTYIRSPYIWKLAYGLVGIAVMARLNPLVVVICP